MEKLQEKYNKVIIPAMQKKFGYKNPMAVPHITKVTLNSSFGKATATKTSGEREKVQKLIMADMALIAGQAPRLVKSKKSIAGFKLREGLEIAAMVTLRKQRMWDFLERFIYLSLPRSRDFQGLNPKSIDQRGNMNIGFREHILFPEIFVEKEKTIFGLEITISTNAKSREEGLELFTLLGLPLKKDKKEEKINS
ncbi:50S ribosomal protein L5 [Candidatus Parcubacteria bacterium]|nr:50S ribosomal protein L5 [Candidatus Parcubacteria bacterium]